MITANHQTFSKCLSGKTKIGQIDLPYIINGEVIKVTKRKINVWTTSFVIISTETE